MTFDEAVWEVIKMFYSNGKEFPLSFYARKVSDETGYYSSKLEYVAYNEILEMNQ